MFAISKELNVPITPVLFDRFRLDMKGVITNKKFNIDIGKTHVVKSVDKSAKYVHDFFVSGLKQFKHNR